MGNVPALRFPEFSGEWELKRLSSFIFSMKGGASLTPKDFTDSGGQEVIPKKAVVANGWLKLDKQNPTHCTQDFFDENQNHVIDNSHLVTTLRDLVPSAPSIGYVVKIKQNSKLMLAQGVYAFKIKEACADKSFMVTLSNTFHYRVMMIRTKVGSTQVHIRNQDYLSLRFFFPKLPEQQKIAHFLTTVDTKIQQLQQKQTLLQQYKKGVMQQLFSQALRFKDDEGGDYADWEERRLGELCKSIVSGKSKKEQFGGIPVYGSTGIIGFSEKATHSGAFILVARVGANAGKLNFVKGEFAVTDNTLIIDLRNNDQAKFIFLLLQKMNLNRYIFGSGQPLITGSLLKNLKVKTPSNRNEQQKIANFLSAIDEKISQTTQQLEHTRIFKKGLLQQMFV